MHATQLTPSWSLEPLVRRCQTLHLDFRSANVSLPNPWQRGRKTQGALLGPSLGVSNMEFGGGVTLFIPFQFTIV